MKKRAVIMGATGFIGRHLTEELLANDYELTVIARDSQAARRYEKEGCAAVLREDAGKAKAGGAYDVFFFAAWDGVAPEHKDDISLQLSNIPLALDAMKLAKEMNCRRFVATGTVAEYVFCHNIIDVGEAPVPGDFYGAAKVSARFMMEVLARQISIEFIWSILPSTFGPGRKGDNIITYTVRELLKGGRPRYGKLEQLWDFLYVGEVARALRLIGEKGTSGKIYGIGSGQFCTLRKYVETIRDCIDPSLALEIGARPDMDEKTFSSCVNNFDLIHDTGFQIQISFEEGIRRTISYMRENLQEE